MSKITKAALLDRAKEAVADRGLNYGKPEDNFNRIANRWRCHITNRYGVIVLFDATDVAVMCADLKLARIEHQPDHLDSWADLAGYAACGANIACEEPKTFPAGDGSGTRYNARGERVLPPVDFSKAPKDF